MSPPHDLYRRSFAELAIDLSLTRADSPRAEVLERELRRRIAAENCERARQTLLIALCVGALLALAGFTLGAYLRTVPPKDVPSKGTERTQLQQTPPRDLRKG